MKYRIALCCIAKNENSYIREWVEYYKKIGIDHIFIYDNNDIDGEHFDEVINDYINSKYVSIIDFRGKVKSNESDKDGLCTQGVAYKDCLLKNWKNFDYICFFDCDEFLSIEGYKNFGAFLSDFSKYDGIKVQWRCYGDNNQIFYENKPVLERFKNNKNYKFNKRTKTILKCKDYSKKDLKFCAHGPLNKDLNLVNLHKQLSTNPYMDPNNNGEPFDDLKVYLDHFYCKSTDEFFRRKFNKTSAVTGINKTRNFDFNFLFKQYFESNVKTKEKIDYINEFKEYYESVDVYIASLYGNGFILNTLKSLIDEPEIKNIFLSANNYTDKEYINILNAIKSNKLHIIRTDNDKKSFEKLKLTYKGNSKYVAFCDDDIIYPRNYFHTLISKCNKYNSPVSCHGSKFTKFPIANYYKDRRTFTFTITVNRDVKVDVIGNGVSLMKREFLTTDEWKNLYYNAPKISMDDIIISDKLRKKGYDLYVIKHSYGWLKEDPANKEKNTVYNTYKINCDYQTKYVNDNFVIGSNYSCSKQNNDLTNIDYVITYVNNREINWIKSYVDTCQKQNTNIYLNSARFRNNNTLKYHLRGVEKFMPWIRNVYLVVSNIEQVPSWINKYKVKIILHKDIVPKQFLPTFNSNTIEMFLCNIKGLSENFIYANDDTYPNSKLEVNDFFDVNNNNLRLSISFLDQEKTNVIFKRSLENTQNLVLDDLRIERYENKILKSDHTIKPMRKSIFKYFIKNYEKEIYHSITTFRNIKNITLELCSFYHYLTDQYSFKITYDVYKEYNENNLESVLKCIKNKKINMLCINDVTSFKGNFKEYNDKLIKCFEEKFPKKSKYEI